MKYNEYDEQTKTLITTKQKHYLDLETNQEIVFDQINKRIYGAKHFWKCYLMDFMSVLGILENKQIEVFAYICENTNPTNNLFIGTYKKINKDTGVSEPTIARIIKKLQEKGFIKKVQNGVWFVNPDILMKGGEKKRQILLSYYESDEPIDEITFSRTRKPLIEDKKEVDIETEVNPQLEFNGNGDIVERVEEVKGD